MDEIYTAVCELNLGININNNYEEITEYCVITQVANYTQAITKLEEYYGSDPESIKITLIDTPVCIINEEIATKLIEGKKL